MRLLPGEKVHPDTLSVTTLKVLGLVFLGIRNRNPYTIRELMRILKLSPNGVSWHLRRLKRCGLIDWEGGGAPRTLHPTCRFIPAKEIPENRVDAPQPRE